MKKSCISESVVVDEALFEKQQETGVAFRKMSLSEEVDDCLKNLGKAGEEFDKLFEKNFAAELNPLYHDIYPEELYLPSVPDEQLEKLYWKTYEYRNQLLDEILIISRAQEALECREEVVVSWSNVQSQAKSTYIDTSSFWNFMEYLGTDGIEILLFEEEAEIRACKAEVLGELGEMLWEEIQNRENGTSSYQEDFEEEDEEDEMEAFFTCDGGWLQ